MKNGKYCAYFINKLISFTSAKVKFNVIWNTHKIQSLFALKDKVQHLSCITYKGICSCGETFVCETITYTSKSSCKYPQKKNSGSTLYKTNCLIP